MDSPLERVDIVKSGEMLTVDTIQTLLEEESGEYVPVNGRLTSVFWGCDNS